MSARQRQLWELQQRLKVSRKQNADAVVAERRRVAKPDGSQVRLWALAAVRGAGGQGLLSTAQRSNVILWQAASSICPHVCRVEVMQCCAPSATALLHSQQACVGSPQREPSSRLDD